MPARCPVCGGTTSHRDDCLYRARTSADRRGCAIPLGLLLVFWLSVVAGAITVLGGWPATFHTLHELARSIAPGIIH